MTLSRLIRQIVVVLAMFPQVLSVFLLPYEASSMFRIVLVALALTLSACSSSAPLLEYTSRTQSALSLRDSDLPRVQWYVGRKSPELKRLPALELRWDEELARTQAQAVVDLSIRQEERIITIPSETPGVLVSGADDSALTIEVDTDLRLTFLPEPGSGAYRAVAITDVRLDGVRAYFGKLADGSTEQTPFIRLRGRVYRVLWPSGVPRLYYQLTSDLNKVVRREEVKGRRVR